MKVPTIKTYKDGVIQIRRHNSKLTIYENKRLRNGVVQVEMMKFYPGIQEGDTTCKFRLLRGELGITTISITKESIEDLFYAYNQFRLLQEKSAKNPTKKKAPKS